MTNVETIIERAKDIAPVVAAWLILLGMNTTAATSLEISADNRT